MKKIIVLILLILLYGCSKNSNSEHFIIPTNSEQDLKKITILYTNDEHGWIESSYKSNGAANMMGLWEKEEGYDGDDSYLILSGGDNWLGATLSDQFNGAPVVDVMNSMDYDAAAIGNHEFEYGMRNLQLRISQAKFDYISANIRKKDSNEIPYFIRPYIIKEVNDILVGIIGLTPRGTPNNTITEFVQDYEFLDYLTALDEIVPMIKSEGAELIVLIAHLSYADLRNLAPKLLELGISVAGGAHCHRDMIPYTINEDIGDLALFQAGPYMKNYIRVDILFDKISKKAIEFEYKKVENRDTEKNSIISTIIDNWKNKIGEEISF